MKSNCNWESNLEIKLNWLRACALKGQTSYSKRQILPPTWQATETHQLFHKEYEWMLMKQNINTGQYTFTSLYSVS